MRRATITIPNDLEASLEAYTRQQEVSPALTAVLQAALQEYLARRGFLPGTRRLVVTPAKKGSGAKDVSRHHDRYLAGK